MTATDTISRWHRAALNLVARHSILAGALLAFLLGSPALAGLADTPNVSLVLILALSAGSGFAIGYFYSKYLKRTLTPP